MQFRAFLSIAAGVLITLGIILSCEKETVAPAAASNSNAAPPCDSLSNVVWGDTLRVVPRTITQGRVRRGPHAGKFYWQAMLYSDQRIDPTNFQNDKIRHRVVIADTTLITEASVFIIARIK